MTREPQSNANTWITCRVLRERFEQGTLDAADELIHPDFVGPRARDHARASVVEFLGLKATG